MEKLTEVDLFEAFYSIIADGTGKQAVDFFNEQLNKCNGKEENLEFLKKALSFNSRYEMTTEVREIFREFNNIVREEIRKTKELQ